MDDSNGAPLVISILALVISATQAVWSILQERKRNKSSRFMNFISVKFLDCEGKLDALEERLRRARISPAIGSSDILEVAILAVRSSQRALREVSELPEVRKDITHSSKIDELDAILNYAGDGCFDSEHRNLAIETSINIVSRVCSCVASEKKILIVDHLK